MHVFKKVGIAAGLVAAAAVSVTFSAPANADTAARSGDVVGVGSDTLQNAADFLFDGAPGVAGGYNNLGNNHRVMNVFATGDANGRATYDGTCGTADATTGLGQNCGTTTNKAPNVLPATVILRAGTEPVVRPNGSGGGAAALNSDSKAPGYQGLPAGSIQFARMSRLPNSGEEANCLTTDSTCGGLHVYQIATDQLVIAHDKASYNGPGGLSAQQLYAIFVTCTATKWTDVGGTSTDTIHPLIPQSGSGTRNFFLADLQAAMSLPSTPAPGDCTRTVQEHDPTGIIADPSPADAIEPFSKGKITLLNTGYFQHAGYANGAQGAYAPNSLTYLTGTPSDTHTNYDSTRGLYITIRNADLASATPFQVGGTLNWAQTLFAGPDSYVARADNNALIAAAGFTPDYQDCGVNPGATCGS